MSRLPADFFKQNPLDKQKAALLTCTTLLSHEKQEIIVAEAEKRYGEKITVDPHTEDIKLIDESDTPEKLVNTMRKLHGTLNYDKAVEKALTMEEDIMPLIIAKFLTSTQKVFIDCAVKVFLIADEKYADELYERYRDIRSPYAKSLACLVFSTRIDGDLNDFLVREHKKMKREYPDEDFSEGPLLALYFFNGMIR